MSMQLLWNAPLAVQLHVYTVVPAFVLGTWLLLASRKGSPLHKGVGRIYVVLMLATCATALFIHVLNPDGWLGLSFVHVFIVSTLIGLGNGIRSARRGNLHVHRRAMIITYVSGLIVAGSFTLMPGRLMHRLLFGY